MNRRLTLVCHAATAATRAAAFAADEGIERATAPLAAALGSRIGRRSGLPDLRMKVPNSGKPEFGADQAWTSPALAARQTAAALGLDATEEPALRDVAFGRWAGRGLADVAAEDPQGVAAWLGDPDAAPHGGESLAAVLARVAAWLDARVAERGHVVAVTHAAVLRAAVVAALGAPAAAFWRVDVEPLGIIELGSDGRRWNLRASAI